MLVYPQMNCRSISLAMYCVISISLITYAFHRIAWCLIRRYRVRDKKYAVYANILVLTFGFYANAVIATAEPSKSSEKSSIVLNSAPDEFGSMSMTYSDAKNHWSGGAAVLLRPDRDPKDFDMYSLGATFQMPADENLPDIAHGEACVRASYLFNAVNGAISLIGDNKGTSSDTPRVKPEERQGKLSLEFTGDHCRYLLSYQIFIYNFDRWIAVATPPTTLTPLIEVDHGRSESGTGFYDSGQAEPLEFAAVPHVISLGFSIENPHIRCPSVSGLMYFDRFGIHIVLPWKTIPEITPGLWRNPTRNETSIILQTQDCRLFLNATRETKNNSSWEPSLLSKLR